MADQIIQVKHLKKYFDVPKGKLHAVDDVTFNIERGYTIGVVGESGCGKSTLGRTLLHLYNPTDGQIMLNGRDVTHQTARELKQLHQEVAMIFQDPYSSLNPRYTIAQTLDEPLRLILKLKGEKLEQEKRRIMDLVGLDQRFYNAYPHELDGGRRQRIGIGRALALNPQFIICDEPISALDVSIQAQILNLLMDLQDEYKLTYMFITHNLAVVRHISHDICVMYLGQMVELCSTETLFAKPMHPYTKALLEAIPSTDIINQKEQKIMKGELTSLINPKPGCRFAARCEYAGETCMTQQKLEEIENGHFVSCCQARRVNGQ